MMVASENPILPTEGRSPDKRIRMSWTRRGIVLAGLGCALFLVGMWRVDGVMATLGVGIGALFPVVLILGRHNLTALLVEYQGPRRVEAGKGFSARLTIRNQRTVLDGFRIRFGISLMGEKSLIGKVSWLGGGGAAEIAQRISVSKRGCEISQKCWVESGFPLGLLNFRKESRVMAEIGVQPRSKVPGEMILSGFLLDGPPLGGSRFLGGIGEWRGLREFRGGDSVRRVAWAASLRSEASGGGLLVREDEPPGSQAEGCFVIFHSHGGDGSLIRPDRFEKSISLLIGALGALQSWGMPVRWISDFNGWEERELKTRRHLASARENLMLANRAAWTEAHDLRTVIAKAKDSECLVIISDMPLSAWSGMIPKTVLAPVIVDISKYDVSSKLRKGTAK